MLWRGGRRARDLGRVRVFRLGLLGFGFGSGFGFGFGFGSGLLGDLLRIRWFLPIGVRGRRIGVSLGAVLERGQLGAGRRRRAQLASKLRVPRLTGGRG